MNSLPEGRVHEQQSKLGTAEKRVERIQYRLAELEALHSHGVQDITQDTSTGVDEWASLVENRFSPRKTPRKTMKSPSQTKEGAIRRLVKKYKRDIAQLDEQLLLSGSVGNLDQVGLETQRRTVLKFLLETGVPGTCEMVAQLEGIKKALQICLSIQERLGLEEREEDYIEEIALLAAEVFMLKDGELADLESGRLGHPMLTASTTRVYFDYLVVGSYSFGVVGSPDLTGKEASRLHGLMKISIKEIEVALDDPYLQTLHKQALISRLDQLNQAIKRVSVPALYWTMKYNPGRADTLMLHACQQVLLEMEAIHTSRVEWDVSEIRSMSAQNKMAQLGAECRDLTAQAEERCRAKLKSSHDIQNHTHALADVLVVRVRYDRLLTPPGTACAEATRTLANEAITIKWRQLGRLKQELDNNPRSASKREYLEMQCSVVQKDVNHLCSVMMEHDEERLLQVIHNTKGAVDPSTLGAMPEEELKELGLVVETSAGPVMSNIQELSALCTIDRICRCQTEVELIREILHLKKSDSNQKRFMKERLGICTARLEELEGLLKFWKAPDKALVDHKILEQLGGRIVFQDSCSVSDETIRGYQLLLAKEHEKRLQQSSMHQRKREESNQELERQSKELRKWSNNKAKREAELLQLELSARKLDVARQKKELELAIAASLNEQADIVFGTLQENEAIARFEFNKRRDWMETTRLLELAKKETTQAREEQSVYDKLIRQMDLEDELYDWNQAKIDNQAFLEEMAEVGRWKEQIIDKELDETNATMHAAVNRIILRQEAKAERRKIRKEINEKDEQHRNQFRQMFGDIQQPIEMWKMPRSKFSKPHTCPVRLEVVDGMYVVRWESQKKTVNHSQLYLSRATKLVKGKKAKPGIPSTSSGFTFSLVNPNECLELCAIDQTGFDLWINFLEQYALKHSVFTGTPHLNHGESPRSASSLPSQSTATAN